MIRPMIILFLLGAVQGLVGWIMVMSGLEDSEALYVSHYKLAIHFILALGLLCYTLWFALELLVPQHQIVFNTALRKFTGWIIVLLVIQLVYGAFMAGLKAATAAPTWPTINGEWLPGNLHSFGNRQFPGISFLFDNPIMVQFIHRGLAYLVVILVVIWSLKAQKIFQTSLFSKTKWLPPVLVLVQVLLGILTVLNALQEQPFLWLGIAHQFMAMILLLSFVWMIFVIRNQKSTTSN